MTHIYIIFSSIFLSNILLTNLIGMPLEDKNSNLKPVVIKGVKLLIISLLLILIVYPINHYLIEDWFFLMPIIVVLVGINLHLLVNLVCKKLNLPREEHEFNLITPINAVIIVIGLLAVGNGSYLTAIAETFGLALGYLMVTILITTIKPRLDLPGGLKAFKGLPLLLITLALIAMVFMGLSGIFAA